MIKEYKERILKGELLTKEEIMELINAPLEELTAAANEIREKMAGNAFDLCTIINGKSGRCSEDCKYCAQSAHFPGKSKHYPLLDTEEILKGALENEKAGVLRYSIVTSGKRLSDLEIERICETIREIRSKSEISICISFGLLSEEQFKRIKEAGASRVHCNLETSRRYFPEICSTHTFEEKIETLKAARRAGLSICSGGIMGLGETMEDRIDMVLTARELGVRSIPVNILNPIPGTPFEKNCVLTNDVLCRIVAIFRFIIPDGMIRLAGGRGLLGDKGEKAFQSGANAAISGDMLTTSGISTKTDMELLENLGFEVKMI